MKQTTCHPSRSGFTLIELSIVLVIIGLIVSGIFVGRDLIRAAEIRQTISQKESFDAAVNTFRFKYNCLPGDCANASQFGLNTSSLCGNCNGNGDGILGTVNGGLNDDEFKYFWLHLFNAGMLKSTQHLGTLWYGYITVPGYHSPTCPVCQQFPFTSAGTTLPMGGWLVQRMENSTALNCAATPWTSQGGQLPSGNVFMLAQYWGGSYNVILNAPNAFAIDSKVDDGLPLTGSVVAVGGYMYSNTACSGNNGFAAISIPSCVSNGSYVTNTTSNCTNLIMRASF